jgi:hypothetical protein
VLHVRAEPRQWRVVLCDPDKATLGLGLKAVASTARASVNCHDDRATSFTCSILQSSSFASDPTINSTPLCLISSMAVAKSPSGKTTTLETNKSPTALRRPMTPIG